MRNLLIVLSIIGVFLLCLSIAAYGMAAYKVQEYSNEYGI